MHGEKRTGKRAYNGLATPRTEHSASSRCTWLCQLNATLRYVATDNVPFCFGLLFATTGTVGRL